VKNVVSSMMKVLSDTVKGKKMDGGGVLVLGDVEPMLQFAVGIKVANGPEFEASFRKLVQLASAEPGFPNIDFNVGAHQGVNFHSMKIPSPDQAARKIFGETIQVALGIGQDSVYLGVGGDGMSLIKSVIDKSAAAAGQNVPPMKLQVALTPIIRFASSVEEAPQLQIILDSLTKSGGRDHLTISATSIPNGVKYRVDVEEGILQAIGQGVKSAAGGGGGF
jgi:hypothetical protein